MNLDQVRKQARRWGSRLDRRREALDDSDVEVGFAMIHGTRIRYAVSHGVGDPLLFCNGIGANLELMTPFMRALKGRRVIAFDVPGVGGSKPALFWPSYAGFARYAVGLLDTLGYTGQFDVAGVSWGGGLAQTIAHLHPKRVGNLILMATAAGWPMIPGHFAALARMATPQRYISRTFMARNAAIIYGGEVRGRRDLAVKYANMTKAPRTSTYLMQLAAVGQFTSWPWLHRVQSRTLVMNGDDDPLIRPLNAKVLACLIPNAKLHIVKGGGHLFMLLRPDEIAGEIRQFLAETDDIHELLESSAGRVKNVKAL